MASESEESSYVVARLLNGLKEVYTFKELEEFLGIPSQVLWRYTSYSQFPERHTAKKILDAIREKRLVEKALREALLRQNEVVEEWRILFNPRILNLVGYVIWKFYSNLEVDTVLTYPERNAGLAVMAADWLLADVAVASERAYGNWGKLLTASYVSGERGEIVYLHIPKDSIPKDSKVLVVKSIVNDFQSLNALSSLVEQARAQLVGAVAIIALSDKWVETVSRLNLKNIKVLLTWTREGFYVNL
ncbi:MAG: hypothetical protein ACPLRJ_00900 [Infirmifilum uzonense]|uniref:hypothetical protein n=1 Tax=Infirmifilum uzonense TaxID=1550241 RepID=UPI003C717088